MIYSLKRHTSLLNSSCFTIEDIFNAHREKKNGEKRREGRQGKKVIAYRSRRCSMNRMESNYLIVRDRKMSAMIQSKASMCSQPDRRTDKSIGEKCFTFVCLAAQINRIKRKVRIIEHRKFSKPFVKVEFIQEDCPSCEEKTRAKLFVYLSIGMVDIHSISCRLSTHLSSTYNLHKSFLPHLPSISHRTSNSQVKRSSSPSNIH